MEPNIDVIAPGDIGLTANKLMASSMAQGNLDVGLMRPYIKSSNGRMVGMFVNQDGRERPVQNAVLRKEEWVEYDTALIEAAKIRLRGVADLLGRGLEFNIANGFGKTVLEWETMTELGEAQVNMDAVPQPENDRLEFNLNYLPLPIVHKGFQINARVLAASRNTGSALDTTQAFECSLMVNDKLEDILFNGLSSYTYGGGTIYGYTDYPYRTTGNYSEGDWDDISANSIGSVGAIILKDVLAMKADSIADRHYGPWVLYIPTNFETVMEQDYEPGYPKSIRQRLLEVEGLEDIVVADKLAADNSVLVQMTPNVVRMVTGMPLTTVEWDSLGGMVHNYRVMTIMVPQLRADANNRTGIVHYQ